MSSPRLLGLILGAALVAAALPSAAAPPKTPTIRQSIDMVAVNAPKISPDGRRVVYEQARTNWDANAFETDLWIADVATGERHLLTTASKSSTEAAWSPDGGIRSCYRRGRPTSFVRPLRLSPSCRRWRVR